MDTELPKVSHRVTQSKFTTLRNSVQNSVFSVSPIFDAVIITNFLFSYGFIQKHLTFMVFVRMRFSQSVFQAFQ